MREEFFFNTLFVGRMGLVESVGKCPLDKRDVVPVGFTTAFFKYGTRPSEWTEEPPAWDDILTRLKDQISVIRSTFTGKLDAKVKANPFKRWPIAS